MHDVYAAMLKLRNLYPGLANPAASGLVYSLNGAVKSLQVSTDSLSVAVIGNFYVPEWRQHNLSHLGHLV